MIHSLRTIEWNADCDVRVDYDVISYEVTFYTMLWDALTYPCSYDNMDNVKMT